MQVSHTGLMAIVREAKDKGHVWADCALAELALLTGQNYQFEKETTFDKQVHQIVRGSGHAAH